MEIGSRQLIYRIPVIEVVEHRFGDSSAGGCAPTATGLIVALTVVFDPAIDRDLRFPCDRVIWSGKILVLPRAE